MGSHPQSTHILQLKLLHLRNVNQPNMASNDISDIKTPPSCTADFCLIPLGTPTASVSKEVAEVQRILKRSGLNYSMHSAGTTLGLCLASSPVLYPTNNYSRGLLGRLHASHWTVPCSASPEWSRQNPERYQDWHQNRQETRFQRQGRGRREATEGRQLSSGMFHPVDIAALVAVYKLYVLQISQQESRQRPCQNNAPAIFPAL